MMEYGWGTTLRSTAFTAFDMCDSDHVGCTRSHRSVSSRVVYLDGCMIASQVAKQNLEATSSGEAEFYSIADAAHKTFVLEGLLGRCGLPVK